MIYFPLSWSGSFTWVWGVCQGKEGSGDVLSTSSTSMASLHATTVRLRTVPRSVVDHRCRRRPACVPFCLGQDTTDAMRQRDELKSNLTHLLSAANRGIFGLKVGDAMRHDLPRRSFAVLLHRSNVESVEDGCLVIAFRSRRAESHALSDGTPVPGGWGMDTALQHHHDHGIPKDEVGTEGVRESGRVPTDHRCRERHSGNADPTRMGSCR